MTSPEPAPVAPVPPAQPTTPDAAERIVWGLAQLAATALVGWALESLGVDLAGLEGPLTELAYAAIFAVVAYLTIIARRLLAFLPNPGGGLPGMPTGRGVPSLPPAPVVEPDA